MKKINYSFHPIDIENYFSLFNKNRSFVYFNLLNKNLKRRPNFNHICNKISVQLKRYNSSTAEQNMISTLDFTIRSICKIILEKELDDHYLKIIYKFQKKIEIYSKLFCTYKKENMTKAVNDEASKDTYILFSMLLLLLFNSNSNFGLFSTSIKITDNIINFENDVLIENKNLLKLLIQLECYSIKKIDELL